MALLRSARFQVRRIRHAFGGADLGEEGPDELDHEDRGVVLREDIEGVDEDLCARAKCID